MKLLGPRQMPLPPWMSIASLTTRRVALGDVVFDDRRDHRRLLAEVDRDRQSSRGPRPSCRVLPPMRASASSMPSNLPIGVLELGAHARVGAGRARRELRCRRRSDGSEIERPAARHSISMRQPWPAIFGPPMIQSSGTKTSLPAVRAVLERRVRAGSGAGRCATPGVRVGMSAQVMPRSASPPSRLVGVVQPEREAEQRRDRPERDVALLPGHAHAEDLACLPTCPCRRRRGRGSPPRPTRRAGWSARSTGSPGRSRAAAGSGASAPRCRSGAGAPPARASSAPSRVTAAALHRVESLVTTCECANAEKPRPPYSFGMIIPRKPLSLMNCQTCGGRSLRT